MGDNRIPTRLDEPARILMWDASQVGLLVAFVFLGILLKDPLTWIVAGLALAHVLGKFTGGRHRRYLLHWTYWHLPVGTGFSRTPPSHLREFIG
jgi:conjugal transfer pilus assembly protein TraL